MSHQKTKRIESPIKGKFYSMIRQNNQTQPISLFSSRITQKRKPIFNESPNKSSVSRSSSKRKQIFSKTEVPKQSGDRNHFRSFIQTQQLKKKIPEQIDYYQLYDASVDEDDSVKSSNIGQDNGLADVKRQLFPQTPIKSIPHQQNQELQSGRQFSSSGWKRHLFEQEQHSTTKQNISISTNNPNYNPKQEYQQKTVLKFSYTTPNKNHKGLQNNIDLQKRFPKESIQKKQLLFSNDTINNYEGKSHRNSQQNLQSKTQTSQNNLFQRQNNQFHRQKRPQKRENQKDIAKSLRILYQKMLKKSQICSKVDKANDLLSEQNSNLKRENDWLKQQLMGKSEKINMGKSNHIRKQEITEQEQQDFHNSKQIKRVSNENIYLKIKMEKAKTILKSLLQISQINQSQNINSNNSIFDIQITLKQVIKNLQF